MERQPVPETTEATAQPQTAETTKPDSPENLETSQSPQPTSPKTEDSSKEQPDPKDENPLADRGIRHRDIIKPDELKTVRVYIIGVGAIGGQVAKQLAHIGVPAIHLVDFDTVDVENLGVQGFIESDLGKKKVAAVAETCAAINSAVLLKTSESKFRTEMVEKITLEGDDRVMIISCVDKMSVRRQIWEAYKAKFEGTERALFVDSRMAAETARVLAVRGAEEKDYYEKTIFSDDDGLQQSCTSKSTIYCANIAAGMVVSQFTRWLRGMFPERDVLFNILATSVLRDSETLTD